MRWAIIAVILVLLLMGLVGADELITHIREGE